ncbi:hypothetical protein L3X38_021850 [Prunus dulcis]|uniref:Uncharacterized protein n=1 Tax=Prunus dulcis TaxID=3755 RepID=A0AAD4VUU3_PRUDU|nr:hypothetical protein L3X38_021850 [Prunus dulcis]
MRLVIASVQSSALGTHLQILATYASAPMTSLFTSSSSIWGDLLSSPTGRCSDGCLVIDFIAEFLGLPLVPPYLESQSFNQSVQNFEGGVNFAVVGATTLDAAFLFLKQRGILIHIPTTLLEFNWTGLKRLCHIYATHLQVFSVQMASKREQATSILANPGTKSLSHTITEQKNSA